MKIFDAIVKKVEKLNPGIYKINLSAPEIAGLTLPGNFFNIKVSNTSYPLLRRPFSICDIIDDEICFMMSVSGEGTKLLTSKRSGDKLNLIGPLGNSFNTESGSKNVVIVAGGLGVAPFPYLTKVLSNSTNIRTFIGGRSSNDIVTYGLVNYEIATDDGSLGFKGNVIQLLSSKFNEFDSESTKIFGCGPTRMLKALKEFTAENNIECEISTECAMACGFGICQGCPVESTNDDSKYLLVCKDGPIFNSRSVHL